VCNIFFIDKYANTIVSKPFIVCIFPEKHKKNDAVGLSVQ